MSFNNPHVAKAARDAIRQAAGAGAPLPQIGSAVRDAVKEIAADARNQRQDEAIALHRKHIQAIWRHLERLEQFIQPEGDGTLRLKVGDASITLKKNGDVTIKGGSIEIDGYGKVTVKASRDVVVKGRNIQEN
jgi:hypothetical protein